MIIIDLFFKLYSFLIGVFVKIPIPKQYRKTVWTIMGVHFLKMKKKDYLDILEPLDNFQTFYEFFTRKIKLKNRPMARVGIVSPADSKIMDWGKIKQNTDMLIKGKHYKMSELVGMNKIDEQYRGGIYINLYLAPYNYHRFHSPVTGKIKEIKYIAGSVFPVNSWGINNIDSLYSKNKRFVITIDTKLGEIKYIAVGASAVGDIQLSVSKGDDIKRGEELGFFGLGSTVILLLPISFKGKVEKRRGSDIKVRSLLLK